ncbi:hexitol phosphatase HxpB [Flavivirga abyssicola]|uniref:hexitol phosphatase HxpB n=1 Tax=Flavivirga abyssicola TaxID=3063533 RepID=UPI0026E0C64C|nr:hexitol phosphatase HxpB [Flavivirga sp. MEBiC07777]WVK13837.1 hexitol phosphatase HxpB [Flavivirga sp. MEBiC07777]
MREEIKAVIFDMDGVLIDSEPFWEIAEKKVFGSLGVSLTPELCNQTKFMTTNEVTKFWYRHYQWEGKSFQDVQNEVIECVKLLIKKEGKEIKGIKGLLKFIKTKGFKIGLATNAPYELIPIVLEKLNISDYFDFFTSAEFEKMGKPNPAVYLSVAKNLKINPKNCVVFEDSYSGLLSAKSAGMKTVAYRPKKENLIMKEKIEDFVIHSFSNLNSISRIFN